jgi:ribose 1,5-bisphosphate isomerase
MNLLKNNQFSHFPPEARQLIDDMENKSVLGASRHVRMIIQACVILAEQLQVETGRELIDCLDHAIQYFSQTRGQETVAISNAFAWITNGLRATDRADIEDIRRFFVDRCNAFIDRSLQSIDKIAEYGANLLSGQRSVLAYDYSSTVCAILSKVASEGRSMKVIVPESRTVDGGRPIVEEVVELGHTAHFIPDAAIGYFTRQADAVLVGVETVYSEGSFTNTLGTHMLAEMAKKYCVPFYAVTEILKVDMSSLRGLNRTDKSHELAALYEYPESFSHPEKVSVLAPMVEWIPAGYLNAYITDIGVLAPQAIWIHTREALYSDTEPVGFWTGKEVGLEKS